MPVDRDLFEEEQEMVAMSFGDHIEELRVRLVLALLGLAVGVIVTLIPPLDLGRKVMYGMQEPAQRALDRFYEQRAAERAENAEALQSYSAMHARISVADLADAFAEAMPGARLPAIDPGEQGRFVEVPFEMRDADVIQMVDSNVEHRRALIVLKPLEVAVVFFTVCLVTGLVIASPWVFYQLWAFVAAGLYKHERRYVYRFLPFSIGLFLAGVFLCYFGVLPMTLRFLLRFSMWLSVEPNYRLTDWMGFATILPLVFGLGFQTPLVMLFLGSLQIFTAEDFRSKRKFAILAVVVAAALLTPGPDVVAQLSLAVPMLLLYELGIYLVARVERNRVEAEAA